MKPSAHRPLPLLRRRCRQAQIARAIILLMGLVVFAHGGATFAASPESQSPDGAGNWLQNLSWFLGIGLIAIGIIHGIRKLVSERGEKREIGPQPFKISFASEFTQRHEFEALKQELHNLRGETHREIQMLRAEAEQRSVKLHDRINDVLRGVSRIEGKLENR